MEVVSQRFRISENDLTFKIKNKNTNIPVHHFYKI